MRAALLAAVLVLVAAAPASAAPELVKLGDFQSPVHVASPPNDDRVFVVEQGGVVKIVGGGTFLDISADTLSGGERGLLSMAFAPDYATSGLFYVFLTSKPNGDVEVREYRGSTLVRTLLDEPHSATNHNGGQLQFGPDGALYASIGDNADSNTATNPSSPFGKIHRLVPGTGASQIWSSGLRNPWRFSFDRASGDLLIGDVGGGAYEEINWSRFNEQPWRFVVGRKGDETWAKIFNALMQMNQLWAKNAPILFATFSKKTFSHNKTPNSVAQHDVGAASQNLALQATALGLHAHGMAGFDRTVLRAAFEVPEDFDPVACSALGYLGDPQSLPENFQKMEGQPRSRKPLGEFVFRSWDQPGL